MKKPIILSLQILRTFAFLEIFIYHCFKQNGIDNINFYASGSLGVSIFFILSGFLLIYNYNDKDIKYNFKSSILFAVNKIKKLYLLYIICLVFYVLFFKLILNFISDFDINRLIESIKFFFIDSLLLQSLIPITAYNYSLNGLSWYLSTLFILYMIYPYINYQLKKRKFNYIKFIFYVYILLIMINVIYIYMNGNHIDLEYFGYVCPFYRLGDFLIGCFLGKCFLSYNKKLSYNKASFYEILILTICIFLPAFEKFIPWEYYTVIIKKTLIYIIPSAFLVFIFALNQGFFSKVLSNKFVLYLGSISVYAYLIHEIVIQIVCVLLSHYKIETNTISILLLILFSFLITIILCELYKKLQKKINQVNK